jgi:DNA-binding PadR family transcriptional regulator
LTETQNNGVPAEFTLKEIKTKLVKGSIDILVLLEMNRRKSISGSDIIDLIKTKFSVSLSPGTVYTTLYNVERKGLIYGETNGRKTFFKLTEKGLMVVEALKSYETQIADIYRKLYEI